GAERVVADLAVTHVVVGRKADRAAVRAQRGARAGDPQAIHRGRGGDADRVGLVALADADAVEDREHHRAFRSGEARVTSQCFHYFVVADPDPDPEPAD